MNRARRTILIGLIVSLGLIAAACPKRTSIGDIESNPSKFNGKTVAVAGEVKQSYGISIPFLGDSYGSYKIDDGTGSIWVFTKKSVPTKGALLGVKGKIQTGVNYNGKNYGLGVVEEDRKFKDGK